MSLSVYLTKNRGFFKTLLFRNLNRIWNERIINVLEMVQSMQLLLRNSSYLILIILHIVVHEILDYVFDCSVDFSFNSSFIVIFCLIQNKSHVSVSCIHFSIVLNECHWILSSKKMDWSSSIHIFKWNWIKSQKFLNKIWNYFKDISVTQPEMRAEQTW